MTFYWLYDLPSWLFAAVVIAGFVAFGLTGLFATRGWVRRLHHVDHSHNDIVGYFLAVLTVFYGITLGLVAVGTWNTFSSVSDKVDDEAQIVASLYRDVGAYHDGRDVQLRTDLAAYLADVVNRSWPLQRRGVIPAGSGRYLDDFERHLTAIPAATINDGVVQAEVFHQFNALVETRRARLDAVQSGLPLPIWALVIIGGMLCIAATWFFHTARLQMHFWMTTLTCALLGLIVFMIAILDNPFRGSVSVGSAPLALVYTQLVRSPAIGASPSQAARNLPPRGGR